MRGLAALLLLLALVLHTTEACIYLYGSRHEAPAGTPHYSYGYIGLDWPEEFPTCSGQHQSPIHIPGDFNFPRVQAGDESIFNYGKITSNGTNIQVKNNGHTVLVNLPSSFKPNASVVVIGNPTETKLTDKFSGGTAANATTMSHTSTRVKLTPAQFHFHTRSEHLIDGKAYPLEMHIVNFVYSDQLPACGTGGCIAVVGIMLELSLDPDAAANKNKFVDSVFKVMPSYEGQSSYLPNAAVLDFDDVLPTDRSYVTYYGSLTTPGCTEGVLWHVLPASVTITRDQLHAFEIAVGETNCPDGAATESATTTTPSESTSATSTMNFTMPPLTTDSVDNKQCTKLANGQNYREVQDRLGRPIYFWPATGICESQLGMLADRSDILSNMLYPQNSSDTVGLNQYSLMVAANLTQAANCSDIPADAAAMPPTPSQVSALLLLAVCLFVTGTL